MRPHICPAPTSCVARLSFEMPTIASRSLRMAAPASSGAAASPGGIANGRGWRSPTMTAGSAPRAGGSGRPNHGPSAGRAWLLRPRPPAPRPEGGGCCARTSATSNRVTTANASHRNTSDDLMTAPSAKRASIIRARMRTTRVVFRACALIALMLTGRPAPLLIAAPGDVTVTPGELVIEHPTLINLGFEWHIDGDANRNASVDVSFRKPGEAACRPVMPLARLHGEQPYW